MSIKSLLFVIFLSLTGCDKGGSIVSPHPQVIITPDPVVPKKVELSWTPPAEYVDGTPLPMSDIGGYKIYSGRVTGVYNNITDIQDGYITTYTFTDLDSPTYFVVTCYTINGIESIYSNEVIYK